MVTLLLLRHARATSIAANGDSERPLDERGRQDALALGGWLRQSGLLVDDVLCSPARRARETWQLLSSRLKSPPEAVLESLIYDAGAEALLAHLARRRDAADCILVVGHNPTLHQLAFTLAGSGGGRALDRLTTDFPPGSLVELGFAGGWQTLAAGAGVLRRFVTPKDLERGRETS